MFKKILKKSIILLSVMSIALVGLTACNEKKDNSSQQNSSGEQKK